MACKIGPSTPSNEMAPSPGTVDQTTHVLKLRVGVTDVQVFITELSVKATRQIWLQMAYVPASVHQVGRHDTDQPLECTFSKRRAIASNILKLLTVSGAWNVGSTETDCTNLDARSVSEPP